MSGCATGPDSRRTSRRAAIRLPAGRAGAPRRACSAVPAVQRGPEPPLHDRAEEAAFEYSVLEYPFAFWQYGSAANCASVPGDDASDAHVLEHLMTISPSLYYADSGFLTYQPLFYQAYTEIGYCTYEYAHLRDLLQAVPEPTYRTFAPREAQMTFRPEAMADVLPWLRHKGQRIVYIYGGDDPWTAGALEPDRALDALMVVQPGGNHRVRISDLDRRAEVVAALEAWLSVRITATGIAAATRAPAWERF